MKVVKCPAKEVFVHEVDEPTKSREEPGDCQVMQTLGGPDELEQVGAQTVGQQVVQAGKRCSVSTIRYSGRNVEISKVIHKPTQRFASTQVSQQMIEMRALNQRRHHREGTVDYIG